jgi:hypothetical protein
MRVLSVVSIVTYLSILAMSVSALIKYNKTIGTVLQVLGIILAVGTIAGLYFWIKPLTNWSKAELPNLRYGIWATAVILILFAVTGCLAAPEMVPNSVKAPTVVKTASKSYHKYWDTKNKNITTFHTKYNKKKNATTTTKADTKTVAKDAKKDAKPANTTNLEMAEVPEINLGENEELEIT